MNRQMHSHDVQPFALPLVDQCCRRMEESVVVLIQQAKSEATWTESYSEAAQLLEAVPLSTKEFTIANRHLANAHDYCLDGEFGAACFELRQLRTLLAAL